MTKLPHVRRTTISIACCSVFLLSAVAFALNMNTGNQRLPNSGRKEDEAIKQVKESPDQPLRILGNDDCPLRLVEAKVKEVPGHLFTKLTGRVTDLATVSSVPEATLVNTSGQTVTRFFLLIRDPKSRTIRGLIKSKLSLKPGETFLITREDFVAPEKMTVADKDGQVRQTTVVPGMGSEKKWIQFAARSELFITIGEVNFEDGSSWVIKEGGGVK